MRQSLNFRDRLRAFRCYYRELKVDNNIINKHWGGCLRVFFSSALTYQVLLRLGDKRLEQEQWEKAERFLLWALMINPHCRGSYGGLALCKFQMGAPAPAAHYMHLAIKQFWRDYKNYHQKWQADEYLFTHLEQFYHLRGKIRLQQNHFAGARQDFKFALRHGTARRAKIYYDLALTEILLDNDQASLINFTTCLNLDPTYREKVKNFFDSVTPISAALARRMQSLRAKLK